MLEVYSVSTSIEWQEAFASFLLEQNMILVIENLQRERGQVRLLAGQTILLLNLRFFEILHFRSFWTLMKPKLKPKPKPKLKL